MQLESIGTSLEGRELIFAKVSSNPNASNPVILIDGGIHAREWIAPATVLYILQELVENEANRDLLASIDWYLLPVLNPDGYDFSHTTVNNCNPFGRSLFYSVVLDSSVEEDSLSWCYLLWN